MAIPCRLVGVAQIRPRSKPNPRLPIQDNSTPQWIIPQICVPYINTPTVTNMVKIIANWIKIAQLWHVTQERDIERTNSIKSNVDDL